jgi:hypothetical protein
VFIIQILAMISRNNVFLIIIYVFDGLFKGGLMMMVAEMSAEIGFPLSESLTFGFLEFFKHILVFIINFTVSMLVNPVKDQPTRH